MLQSSTFAQGGRSVVERGSNLLYSHEWTTHLATAITLICPNFFGNPVSGNYFWPFANMQNYNEQSIYFGSIPLILAAGALFADSKQRSFVIIAFLAICCLAVAWRIPGFEAINHLPVFSMADNGRLKLPFAFLASIMAGFGFDVFFNHLRFNQQDKKSFYIGGIIFLVSIMIFLTIITLKVTHSLTEIPLGTSSHQFLFSFQQLQMYIPMIGMLLALIGYFFLRRARQFFSSYQIAVIAFTFTELFVLAWGYNPTVNESDILPNVEAVQFLKMREKQPFRILSADGFFYPNYSAVYGIDDVAGYDLPVYQRYSDLFFAQGGQLDYQQLWDPDWPLIDFLNVKYVISGRRLRPDKFNPVYQTRYFTIYENPYALPRTFMVYDSEFLKDPNGVLDRMMYGRQDLSKKVILEELLESPVTNSLNSETEYSIEYGKYSNDKVVLIVTTQKPGILVMSDLYTPDWTAQIDNRQVKLYRANYAFRAVSVPEGTHTVTFRYSPLAFKVGAAMTSLGLVVLIYCVTRIIIRHSL